MVGPIETRELLEERRQRRCRGPAHPRRPREDVRGIPGPNGAGNTTTIKILTSLLRPTGGEANIHGFNVQEDPKAALRTVGAYRRKSL